MKKIIILLLLLCCLSNYSLTANAYDSNDSASDDRYSIVTETVEVITPQSRIGSNPVYSKTVTRTNYYRNQNNNVLWTLSLTATFVYDGTTSTCASCTHQATSVASGWSIKNSSSGRSLNTATACATAQHRELFLVSEHSMTVNIQCDANGTII